MYLVLPFRSLLSGFTNDKACFNIIGGWAGWWFLTKKVLLSSRVVQISVRKRSICKNVATVLSAAEQSDHGDMRFTLA